MAADVQDRPSTTTNGVHKSSAGVGAGAGAGAEGVISLDSPPLPADANGNDNAYFTSPTDAFASASASASAPPPLADLLDAHSGDIPSFLNSLLSPPPADPVPASKSKGEGSDLSLLDTSLSSLLTRLSLLSQDTSSALEARIADVSRTVPRLSYDLQFMRESAGTLQASLALVQGRVHRTVGSGAGAGAGAGASGGGGGPGGGADPENSQLVTNPPPPTALTERQRTESSLDKLAHLDKLRARLESARDILREAESWSSLESEITSFLAEAAWDKAAARLAEAARSMVVFQATPAEYETRRALLVSLQNGLETALSAALKEVLEGGTRVKASDTARANVDADVDADTDAEHVEGCARFHAIFATMDRRAEFRNYYFTARRRGLLDAWATYEGADFAGFLAKWFALLLERLERERSDMPRIFMSSPLGTTALLAEFISTTLDALSPSIQSRLAATSDALGAVALPELIKAYSAAGTTSAQVRDLFKGLEAQIAIASPSAISPVPGSPLGLTPSPRPGGPHKRGSSQLTPRFGRLPSAHLESLKSASASAAAAADEAALELVSWETPMFEPFLELQTAYPALEARYLLHLLRVDPALASPSVNKKEPAVLVERAAVVFTHCGEAIARCAAFTAGYGAVGLIGALSDFVGAWLDSSAWILDAAPVPQADELDFGIEYSTDDWAAFQAGLKALRACRDVGAKLGSFEQSLGPALGALAAFASTDSLPASRAMELLRQSPLNSSSLSSLRSRSRSRARSISAPSLGTARTALSALTRSTQTHLQSLILAPLRAQLDTYPSLAWAPADKPRRDGLSIPTFSLSPTDTIARVAEGLLNLLRVFEVYGREEALGYCLGALPFVDEAALGELVRGELEAEAGAVGDGNGAGQVGDGELLSPSERVHAHTYHDASGAISVSGPGAAVSPRTSPRALSSLEVPESQSPAPAPSPALDDPTRIAPKLSAEIITSTWISSLALALLAHLTGTTLPRIPRLSASGARQLAADLGYLANAVRALDVVWDELEAWRRAVEVGEEEWRGVVNGTAGTAGTAGTVDEDVGAAGDKGEGKDRDEEQFVPSRKEKEVWRRVGRLRGWTA